MLVADIDAVQIIDETAFVKQCKGEYVSSLRFHQETPYFLSIKIDYEKRESVIEFTGKILLKDYPKLISEETISQCFENINALGFCQIDIDSMMDADVTKCDVTKDIPYDDVPTLTSYIKSHISNYNMFVCKKARNNNLILEKNVTSRKCKKRMTIYDKGKEMSNADNRQFIHDNGLEGAFDGKCRFEINLNSQKQIRDSLRISNTKLKTVLTSDANPIADFVEVAVSQSASEQAYGDRKEYFTLLVLKDCEYDLEKVEAKMRSLYKRGTKFSEVMQPYRDMLNKIQYQGEESLVSEILSRLR